MCRIVWLSVIFVSWCFCVHANNVRITRDLTINAETITDHAEVNFSIAWDNSWRDDFNWDAVYVFLKCKKEGDDVWQHVRLRTDYHQVTSGFVCEVVPSHLNTWAPGVMIYRSGNGSGNANVDVTLQWDIAKQGYSKTDFAMGYVDYTAMCIEMVYVPNGAFYAGDNAANQTLKSAYQPIWEQYDLIRLDAGLVFDSDLMKPTVGRLPNPPENAANHVNMTGNSTENAWVSSRSDKDGYWKVTFPSLKTVRYFGISAVGGSAIPTAFRLQGRASASENWITLYEGTKEEWVRGPEDSYPVSKVMKVNDPKPCREYMLVFDGAAVAINNISMTEEDLSRSTDFAYLVNNYYNTGISLGSTGRGLYADDKENNWSGTLPAAYPTGFYGFYVMKYEISQEQYVSFLNKLTLAQQKTRTIGDALLDLQKGQYVFGESHSRPEGRNGIIVTLPSLDGKPVTFANDLTRNGEESAGQPDDGQTLACNFMNPYDMLAYADWTGLRPMSELEYEKAGRAAYPLTPTQGEFAWNSNDLSSFQSHGTLQNAGSSSERLEGANVNAERRIGGPVRCGSFAAGNTSREMAGASYWGVMELSGNLAELCYNMNLQGRAFQGELAAHGDGSLATDGNTDISASYWPRAVDQLNAFALRGGSYASDASQTQLSDRTHAWGNYTDLTARDSTVTFRLARSKARLDVVNTSKPLVTYLTMENGNTSLNNGRDTVCAGSEYILRGSDLLLSTQTTTGGGRKDEKKVYAGRCEYIWYISENKGATWNVIRNARDRDLAYSDYANDGSSMREVYVKRLIITPEYMSMSNYAVLNVVNTSFYVHDLRDTIQLSNAANGCLIETTAPAQYTWRWKGQGSKSEPLHVSGVNVTSDFYAAQRSDFDNLSGMDFPVECNILIQKKCSVKTDVSIYVKPRNEKKVIAASEIQVNGNDPTKECGVLMMDARDGQVYATVKIGEQCWMAENLRFAMPGYSYIQTGDGNPTIKMGLFYGYSTEVVNSVCPVGWKVPSSTDFTELVTYLNRDGKNLAAVKLKGGNYWSVTKANAGTRGTNSSGFGAMGVGRYQNSNLGGQAWFGTQDNQAWYMDVTTGEFKYYTSWSSWYLNVRCIRQK